LADTQGENLNTGRLVTIATFHDPYQGHIAWGALRSEGIPSWLLGAHHAEVAPHLSIAIGARLATLEADQARSKAILDDASSADGWELCPHCGGSVICRRKRLWIVVALLLLCGIVTPYAPHSKQRYCYECGHKWLFTPAL